MKTKQSRQELVGVLGSMLRTRTSQWEAESDALALRIVRREAAWGIGFGMPGLRGATNIDTVETRTNMQTTATFFHNPDLERSSVGGLAHLWVMIPRVYEPPGRDPKSQGLLDALRGLRRGSGEEDLSRN